MTDRRRWFDRRFENGTPKEVLPDVIERLRGTPARLEDRLREQPVEVLRRRLSETWSIQENVGHLLDLEALWYGRLDDFQAGAAELRATDITNRRTNEARHNERQLGVLLGEFRAARRQLVARLEGMKDAQLESTALHPRLRTRMTVVDMAYFVAEHDDHHLARITEILRRHESSGAP